MIVSFLLRQCNATKPSEEYEFLFQGRGDKGLVGGKQQDTELAYITVYHSLQQDLSGKGWTGLVWTGSDWENTKHLPGQLR